MSTVSNDKGNLTCFRESNVIVYDLSFFVLRCAGHCPNKQEIDDYHYLFELYLVLKIICILSIPIICFRQSSLPLELFSTMIELSSPEEHIAFVGGISVSSSQLSMLSQFQPLLFSSGLQLFRCQLKPHESEQFKSNYHSHFAD